MISLIGDDYRFLQVMSRFGIPLGFGDKSIEEVCKDNGVDCETFLMVVNFICDEETEEDPGVQTSLASLLHYLKQSHIYFLEFCLPAIRRKLLDAIEMKDSDVSFLILKLFDEYVDGIREHMTEEENNLFKLVDGAMNKELKPQTFISTYSHHHQEVSSKLKELKNIIIKYSPQGAKANLLNAALYDIYRCEEELGSHCRIEEFLLIPSLNRQLQFQ
ncbi:MAG: hemerythrin domain-containing protein [Muribaculaceae bacterium]|nr:hemerythrin domain-containing protein [Muribaculaceae bacterium]